MKFRMLQENLRRVLWERIDAGRLTGLRLADQTGFQQAHISNFLNRKRGLSLEGMDIVLSVQRLSVLDLIDSAEVDKRAATLPARDEEFDDIRVVDSHVAASEPVIVNSHVREILKFRKSFLKRLGRGAGGGQRGWERFVAIRLDEEVGASMYPRTTPGATLLLDRHFTAMTPARRGERNMYAVRKDGGCAIGYVELTDGRLILRPHNPAYPISVITPRGGHTLKGYIVGRVCYLGVET